MSNNHIYSAREDPALQTHADWCDYVNKYTSRWTPLQISEIKIRTRLGRYNRMVYGNNPIKTKQESPMEKDARLLLWLAKTANSSNELCNWLTQVAEPLPRMAVDFIHRTLPSENLRTTSNGRPHAWQQLSLLSDVLMRASLYYQYSSGDWWAVALFDELAVLVRSKPLPLSLIMSRLGALQTLLADADWGPGSQLAYNAIQYTADALTSLVRGEDPVPQLCVATQYLEPIPEMHLAHVFEHLLDTSSPGDDLELTRLQSEERRWLAIRQEHTTLASL
jgi:hypothetical protein